MARKKRSAAKSGRSADAPVAEVVLDRSFAEATRERYLNYALSVITSRALPDVRDGLKPVQRRILYAIWNDLRVNSTTRYVKSAAVVGEVIGKYHPHGDQAVYDALVRMAQEFTLRYPLIEGYGNFGSIDGDPPAAMRYTECRLQPIAEAILDEIRQGTVEFRPNYAATHDEPTVLPAQVPNLLINGASGIAVGMATNIPPHNLREVCQALVALLDRNRDLPIETILKHIQGPDFPTGGLILNSAEEIRKIYANGQGTIKVRGTYELSPDRPNQVVITSIPYGVEKDPLVLRIGELISKGQVPQLTNVKDLSTDDIRIVLELREGATHEAALAYLFKNSPLQTNFNVNLTCLQPAADAEVAVPSRLDLKTLLVHFLDFRLDVVTRRLRHELEALLRRIHLLEGFAIVFNALDEAIKMIRNSDGKADAAPKLIKRFKLTELQTDAVLETKLYRLGKLEIKEILDELEVKRARAAEIEQLLDDEQARWKIVRTELKAVAKNYGDDRRTRIEEQAEPITLREEDYIVDEDAWVIVTRDGWVKRQKSFTDVASIRVREEDRVGWVYRAKARQTLILFTSRGLAYTIRINDIPMTTGHGEPIQRQFAFEDGESIVGVLCNDPRCLPAPQLSAERNGKHHQAYLSEELKPENGSTDPQSEGPFAIAITRSGKAVRFELDNVGAVSTRKGRAIVRLDGAIGDDGVVGVEVSDGSEQVLVVTQKARAIVFRSVDVNLVSGVAKGVLAIKLDPKDRVLGFLVATSKGDQIQVRTNRGAIQTIRASKYPTAMRGGKGFALMQRGSVTELILPDPSPVPPVDQVEE